MFIILWSTFSPKTGPDNGVRLLNIIIDKLIIRDLGRVNSI